jgi:hypothetical protein
MSEYDQYENLIKEFIDQRNAIKLMIDDLEKIKIRIESLFPEQLDKRYVRFFEEKVKTMTDLFRVILDMRKEIIKNTKDEFELRRKISGDDQSGDFVELFDIKKIAKRVEDLGKKKILLEQINIEEIPEDAGLEIGTYERIKK